MNVDVVLPAGGADERALVDHLIAELAASGSDTLVAYRGGYRWTQSYEPLRLEAQPRQRLKLRDGGVYLITGGLGGLGLVLAEHLADSARARLVLVGRSALPPEDGWSAWLDAHDESDRTSRKIRKPRALREKGAELLVASADVADLDQMRAIVADALDRFGLIHGVLHAAGVAGDGVIQLKTKEIAEHVIRPKVKGLLVLERVFDGRPLDFMMLFSSIAAVPGPFGQVDYCGANSVLDTYATGRVGGSWPPISVNWDAWTEVGMADETVSRPTAVSARGPAEFEPIEHPYFARRRVDGNQERYAGTFSADKIWFLNEHRLFRQPTFPSTAYIELAHSVYAWARREAGKAVGLAAVAEPVELRDVFFIAPFSVPLGETRELELVLTKEGDEAEFLIRSRSSTELRTGPSATLGAGSSASDVLWQQQFRGRLVPAPTI